MNQPLNPMNQPLKESTTTRSMRVHNPSELDSRLKRLRLPTMRSQALTMMECHTRTENRVRHHLKLSKLEHCKTWSQINWSRIPLSVRHQMDQLRTGEFLKRTSNVLVFGRPGSGKTLLLTALGETLLREGHTVCFAPCSLLVQHLLLAKKELRLPQLLNKLGRVSALIIDDLGYVQQSREEMEVLFTLIADRYEKSSILLSSNLPFSKWESIFKDPMTTAAAIDRLVHRSTILELNIRSYRLEEANLELQKQAPSSKQKVSPGDS
jgi:DNA replication protein DnaC